jgi:hypothetical protein
MSLRVRATLIHLCGSALVAALAWLLVFRVWYPWPLAVLAGGASLFTILVAVDVIIGPALTAVVANPRKPRAELMRDLAVVLALQLAAFAYGMYTVAAARPVALAFEVDLFRLVTAVEVDTPSLPKAPAALQQLPWTGAVTLAAVKPGSAAEQLRTIELGLAGIPLAALPEYWREYSQESAKAWAASKPVAELLSRHPDAAGAINAMAAQVEARAGSLRVLPLLARRSEGVVVLAEPGARIAGILPLVLGP